MGAGLRPILAANQASIIPPARPVSTEPPSLLEPVTVTEEMPSRGTSEAFPWAWRPSQVFRGAGTTRRRRELLLETIGHSGPVTADQADDREAGHVVAKSPQVQAMGSDQLRALLRDLQVDDRRLLECRIVDGWRYADIAALETRPFQ